jgi:hypothetical protein
MWHKVFLGIYPPEYPEKEKDVKTITSFPNIDILSGEPIPGPENRDSSAEPASVSVQQGKIPIGNLYLQPVKNSGHFPFILLSVCL